MSVDILISSSIHHHIVITPSSSETSYVITVNSITGRPFFSGIPMVDMFPNHTLAVHQVLDSYKPIAHHTGENIIGIAKDNNITVIGLIDNAEVTGWMPNGSLVKTVRHVTYVTFPYNTRTNFEDFQLENNHIYCESYDITRLFPSKFPVENPDTDFIYNKEWIRPFHDINLDFCCVQLVQGLCLSNCLPGKDFSITYILRRSSLNPGTRYLARGLNNKNEPGNEIECELIFSRDKEFWSQRWRRGSAPIRWNTSLSSAFSKPVHTASDNFFNGTAEYFKKLSNRFGEDTLIRCFSLLEKGEKKSEHDIYEKFKKSISMLQDEGVKNVSYNPFDLNFYLHYGGTFAAFNKLKGAVTPFLENDGFLSGTLPDAITNTQKGLLRFNCADSLDRANLATFFYSLLVVEKWIKENDIPQGNDTAQKNDASILVTSSNNSDENAPQKTDYSNSDEKSHIGSENDNSNSNENDNDNDDLNENNNDNLNENDNDNDNLNENDNDNDHVNLDENSGSDNENEAKTAKSDDESESKGKDNDNNNNDNDNDNDDDNDENKNDNDNDNDVNLDEYDNIRLNDANKSSSKGDNAEEDESALPKSDIQLKNKRKSKSPPAHSSSTPTITLYKPSPYLTQDVIDFLAKAFVTSGNIVSYLYTNTPAIKTEHIKKFSPSINVEKSDSSITLRRRYQNVASDPIRNKIINHFVNPSHFTSKFILDPDHIFSFPGMFPRDLFRDTKIDVVINKTNLIFHNNNDLIIALPRPMSISRFCIHHCSASSLIILSGLALDKLSVIGHFEIPQTNSWIRFIIGNKDNESYASVGNNPNVNTNNDIALFMVVRFFAQEETFSCGNLRIGCQLPVEGQIYNKWMPLANDEASADRFSQVFDDFMKSKRNLKDALELEKARLGLNIAEEVRDSLAVKHNINPFLCDSNSLMFNLAISTNSANQNLAPNLQCSFCNKKNLTEKDITYFQRSINFRGLVVDYTGGDEYFVCCKDCKEFASNISMLANLYTEEYIVPVDLNNPKFEPLLKMPPKIEHIYETAFPSTVSFLDADLNKLLTSDGGEVKVEGKRKFKVFFFKNTIISKVKITASSTDFKLLYENKEIQSEKIDDNTLNFIFKIEPITHIFNFEIEGKVTLHKFRSVGVYTIDIDENYEKIKKPKPVLEVNSYGYEWHEQERYALYKFDGKKKISEFGVNIMKSESNTIARSIILVHYADNQIVSSSHYILPKVKVGTDLWYKVDTEPFNKLIIYYTDKIPAVRPHIIGFNFC